MGAFHGERRHQPHGDYLGPCVAEVFWGSGDGGGIEVRGVVFGAGGVSVLF